MKIKTNQRIFILVFLGLLSISCYKSWVTLTPDQPIKTPSAVLTPTNTPTPAETPTPAPTLTPTIVFDSAKLGTVENDLVYCTNDGVDLKMDVYYPSSGTEPWAAILFIHGGAWVTGDKTEGEVIPERSALTEAGYLFASINYRLAPAYKFPAMIEDAKCAVRFLRTNAALYNIDAQRIGAMGTSSGAHLAMLVGVADQSAGWDTGQYMDQSSRVLAVVDFYGPSDLADPALNKPETKSLMEVFGAASRSDPDMVRASPVTYISADDPPFLIVQGEEDTVVLPGHSQLFYDRLTAAGVPASLVMVKNAGHGFVSTGGEIVPSRQEISQMVVDFFAEHLK